MRPRRAAVAAALVAFAAAAATMAARPAPPPADNSLPAGLAFHDDVAGQLAAAWTGRSWPGGWRR